MSKLLVVVTQGSQSDVLEIVFFKFYTFYSFSYDKNVVGLTNRFIRVFGEMEGIKNK